MRRCWFRKKQQLTQLPGNLNARMLHLESLILFHCSPLTQWQYFHNPSILSERPFEHLKKKKRSEPSQNISVCLKTYYRIVRVLGISSYCWEKFYFIHKIIFHRVYFKVFKSLESRNKSQVYSGCCLHMLTRKGPVLWYDALVHRGAVCGQPEPRQRQMKKQVLKQKFPFE